MSNKNTSNTSQIENILIKTELLKIDDNNSENSSKSKTSTSSSSTKSDRSVPKSNKRSSKHAKKPVKRLEAVLTFMKDRKSRSRKSKNPTKLEQKKNLEYLIVNITKKLK